MRVWIVSLALALPACSQFNFFSKPVSPQENLQNIAAASPTEAGFQTYLSKHAPQQPWPIKKWDIDTLSLSAFYFHPALKIAKADYAVALAGVTTAGLRPLVGLNGLLSRSNQANGDINPFSYSFQFDIPIITNGKREIGIEIAQHQADIAKIQLAESAWLLRYQLSLDLLSHAELSATAMTLDALFQSQSELLQAFQKRVDVGMMGKAEMLPFQLQYEQSRWQREQNKIQLKQLEQKIIHDAGLTGTQLETAHVQSPQVSQLLQRVRKQQSQPDTPLNAARNMQAIAMTNRMDIQRGLALYAQAEAKLKLEMAKLKPDISLSPGIAYEYGDRVWGLGIAGLLNMLNRSSDLWKQAEAVRENEAVRFYALQQQTVQHCEQQHLNFRQAVQLLDALEAEASKQPDRMRQLEQQWRLGLIDKTEWLQSKIQFYSLQQRLLTQQITVLRAVNEIENTMQVPLLLSTATLFAAANDTGVQK